MRARASGRPTTAASLGLLLLSLAAAAPPLRAADPVPGARVPATAEHRYRLSAAIRPLLFWIGRSNVGGARIVWREEGEGRRGYELLLGSDPARAPRKINRWGYVREDAGPSGATTIGVMNRSEDDDLDQAKASLGRGRDGYLFKINRARVENGVARAEATAVWAAEDYTFRQLDALLQFAERAKPAARVRSGVLEPGTHPGLLFALADLVRAGVDAARDPSSRGPQPSAVGYTFDAGAYDLSVRSWERVREARYGSRTYRNLVRLEFESRNRRRGSSERFVLACATEGDLAGVPVFVRYQPKWWFKVEGVLDPDEPL